MNNFKDWMNVVNKENANFKKANKARKRVIIAKDVIKGLEVELLDASFGGYFGVMHASQEFYESTDKDFRDLLVKDSPVCGVCAKGALLTCAIMRRDELTVNDINNMSYDGAYLSKAMGGIFDADQLTLIEHHYESFSLAAKTGFPFKLSGYRGEARMIAIMNNIIRNKGTFKPELEREQTA